MVHRSPKLSKTNSFFLFGARGTGKSSLLKSQFSGADVLYIDLLKAETEDKFLLNPDALIEEIKNLKKTPKWVIIDEIQKIPKLLDVVHHLIESTKIKFALTGSSARKLKRGAANLLAGRAFVFELFPLTHKELGSKFNLDQYLSWGGLPSLTSMKSDQDKIRYLRSYTSTYLKEEIQAEQIVRKLKPFRLFLDVAAQSNSMIINYSKIANDIGVDTKTVQSYFEILQDTHVGVLIPTFHDSLRKRQKTNPKFYYFDTGVARGLNKRLGQPLIPQTSEYGKLFEQFIILEFIRMNSYLEKDFTFSYLHTNNGLEIDLIVERPGSPTVMVEIKSSKNILEQNLTGLKSLKSDYPDFNYFCLSQDPESKIINGVKCMPWQSGLEVIFG